MNEFLIANPSKICLGKIENDKIVLSNFIEVKGCSYFDLHDRKLFAISEGGISVFNIEKEPILIYQDSTMKIRPSHICYVNAHKMIFSSNYHLGYLRYYKVNPKLTRILWQITFPEGSRIHQAVFNTYNELLYVVDLGLDKIYVYEIVNQKLVLYNTISFPFGSGPRHLCFTSNFVYVVTEYTNLIFQIDDNFNVVTHYPTLNHKYKKSDSSAIRLSPDKNHLYVLNRGENYITLFNIQKNGSLLFVNEYPTYGDHARDFNISKDNKYLIVTSNVSNNLSLFKIHDNSELSLISSDTIFNKGSMIEFI